MTAIRSLTTLIGIIGVVLSPGCERKTPSYNSVQESTPPAEATSNSAGPAEPERTQHAPQARQEPRDEHNEVLPPLFDRVSDVVKSKGARQHCNDLNGCPMTATLLSMGSKAAPAIIAIFGRTRGDDHWRLRLLEVLGRLRHSSIIPFLLRVAKSDPLQPMRVQAFLSLGKQGNPQIRTNLEPLLAKFHPQKHQAELLAIGFAIAALGDKALGESIIRKHFVLPPIPVNYRRWDLLRPGVYAIGQLRMKEFRGQIEDLSARADPFVRREAVKALSSLRDKAAIPAITARLDDTIPGVRTAAVKGLQTLTGLYNNRTPAQWRRWWANEVARGTQGLNQTTQSRNTSRKIELRKDSAASPRKHPDHPLNK